MLMKLAVLTVGRSYLQRTFCDSLEEVRSLAGDDIMEIKAERVRTSPIILFIHLSFYPSHNLLSMCAGDCSRL